MEKMILDEDLAKLRGALSSFSVTTPDQQKLQLLSSLFQNIDETAKIKMVFFLVLNTKMSTTKLLLHDERVEIVNESCQNLDFSALSYIIFNMNLVGDLGEIVSNCPAALTVEVLSGVFAYADSRIKIRGLEKVIIGLFEKILKTSRGIQKDFSISNKLWEFMDTCGEMIWCRSTFENEELLEEDINKILETCLLCVNLYLGSAPLPVNPMYELNILYEKIKVDECVKVKQPNVRIKFKKYIQKLLNHFHNIFNYSFKYDPIESLTAMSENAYVLYEKLEKTPIEPSNISYLNDVKRKPETELEKIARADIYTIMSNVSSGQASENWFKALINFPDLTENEEAIICLKDHLNGADSQDLTSIVALVQEQFNKNSVSNALQELYFCCLSNMTLVDQLFHFENYFALKRRPNLENSTFDEELTEMFNKILESQARNVSTKSRLINFCIRSPVKTIRKICEHALSNTGQVNITVEDLKMLKAACLIKTNSPEGKPKLNIISSVLCDMIDIEGYGPREKPIVIGLITRLQKERLLDERIENFILDIIHREVSLGKYEKIEFGLEIFKSFIKTRLFRSNEILLLAFFSQVLNHASWSCSSFSAKLATTRDLVGSIISLLIRNLTFPANDKGLVWLRNNIMKSWEINRLRFCDLWYSYGCDFTTSSDLYIQLLILLHTRTKFRSTIDFIANMFRSRTLLSLRISFTAAFIQILPILTSKEWPFLLSHVKSVINAWRKLQKDDPDIDVSLMVFRIFTMSLYSLAQDMNRNKDMTPCFTFCLRNFGKMIHQNFFMDAELKCEDGAVLVEEIIFLLNGIEDPLLRRESSVSLSPIIMEIGTLARKNGSEKENALLELENWYKKKFIEEIPNIQFSDQ